MIKAVLKGVPGTPDHVDHFDHVELEYASTIYADHTEWAHFEDGFWRRTEVDDSPRYVGFTMESTE